jgi:hypothetical protein
LHERQRFLHILGIGGCGIRDLIEVSQKRRGIPVA